MKRSLLLILFATICFTKSNGQHLSAGIGLRKDFMVIGFDTYYTYEWPTATYQFNQVQLDGNAIDFTLKYSDSKNRSLQFIYSLAGYKTQLGNYDTYHQFRQKRVTYDYQNEGWNNWFTGYHGIGIQLHYPLLKSPKLQVYAFAGIKVQFLSKSYTERRLDSVYTEFMEAGYLGYSDSSIATSDYNETNFYFDRDFIQNHLLTSGFIHQFQAGLSMRFKTLELTITGGTNFFTLQKNHLFGFNRSVEFSLKYWLINRHLDKKEIQYNEDNQADQPNKVSYITKKLVLYAGLGYPVLNQVDFDVDNTYFEFHSTSGTITSYYKLPDEIELNASPLVYAGIEKLILPKLSFSGELSLNWLTLKVPYQAFYPVDFNDDAETFSQENPYYLDHLKPTVKYTQNSSPFLRMKFGCKFDFINLKKLQLYVRPGISFDANRVENIILARQKSFAVHAAIGIDLKGYRFFTEFSQSLSPFTVRGSLAPSSPLQTLTVGIQVPLYKF